MTTTDRLYDLYCCYFDCHRDDFEPLNNALDSIGSAVRIRRLERGEFIERLTLPTRNPEIRRAWLNRIVRGQDDGEQLIEKVLHSLAE